MVIAVYTNLPVLAMAENTDLSNYAMVMVVYTDVHCLAITLAVYTDLPNHTPLHQKHGLLNLAIVLVPSSRKNALLTAVIVILPVVNHS